MALAVLQVIKYSSCGYSKEEDNTYMAFAFFLFQASLTLVAAVSSGLISVPATTCKSPDATRTERIWNFHNWKLFPSNLIMLRRSNDSAMTCASAKKLAGMTTEFSQITMRI